MLVDDNTGKLNRVQPQNIDAERSVLGAMLMADSSEATVSIGLAKIERLDFYREAHRFIFDAIGDLFDQSIAIDIVTVTRQLGKNKTLETVGGVPYINEMMDSMPTTANIEYWIDIIKEDALKRQVIHTTAQLYNRSFEDDTDGKELLADLQKQAMEIGNNGSSELTFIKDNLKDTFNHIQKLYATEESITGLSTGFTDLDAYTAGLQDAEYSILAARPSVGKSAMLQAIIEHVGMTLKKPVLLFSPEMSEKSVMLRMLGSIAGISGHKLRMGALEDADWPRLTIAAGKLAESKILIDDKAGISIGELRAKAYQAKMRYDIELIVVDYIQELCDPNTMRHGRVQEMGAISGGLQKLARELDIPVLVASQLNRSCEARPDKRPLMSDLRESGELEQHADLVMFLYRESYYDKECKNDITEVIIRKQRNGPTGTIKLYFDMQKLRFENLARGYKDDAPY